MNFNLKISYNLNKYFLHRDSDNEVLRFKNIRNNDHVLGLAVRKKFLKIYSPKFFKVLGIEHILLIWRPQETKS